MKGHVAKKGRRWYAVVSATGEDGRRRRKWLSGFDTKRQAQAALIETLAQMQRGGWASPSRMTTGEFLLEWIEARRTQVRPSTWLSYRGHVVNHLVPTIGAIPLQRLNPPALNAMYAGLLEHGRHERQTALNPRTVRYAHTIIRRALADAVRWGYVTTNVADRAEPPRHRSDSARNVWTADELRQFLAHVEGDRLYAAWVLAATTGMRRGEVLGLRWRDVDLDACRVAVTQTLISLNYKVSVGTPKTAKGRRLIALDKHTVSALRTHRLRQVEERLLLGVGLSADDFVLTQEDGAPVHPDRFSDLFGKLIRATGLPRIRLHDLRHTHATLALQAGVHPKVVSERLGHSTIAITLDTYSHAVPALQEDAATRVADIVFGVG